MSGTLFLVATPIGNLEDITLRALRVLREVDLIAAEDTRRTGQLLAHYGISTRTLSFHEHNTRTRVPQLLTRLKAGDQIAVVTDAGTPGMSDPGVELVESCVREGITVDAIPGANAHITAAVVSGFPLLPLTCFGFSPNKPGAREEWLRAIASIPHTVVFLETPHRIITALRVAGKYFGDRPMLVGRELTKVHQEFIRGTASDIAERLEAPRGEFTIVLGPALPIAHSTEGISDAFIADEFGRTANNMPGTRRDAVAAVARNLGVTKKRVYVAVERAKKYGE